MLTQLGVKFKGIDVLTDPSLRQGIKEFSHWPTIPQLYVKGEFIGGCDIVREMYAVGRASGTAQHQWHRRSGEGLRFSSQVIGLTNRRGSACGALFACTSPYLLLKLPKC